MGRSKLATLMLLPAFVFLALAQTPEEDARAIVERADRHFRGETAKAEMSMTIVRPDWSREVRMKTWFKGQDYALILITYPDRDRGITFLKRKNEIWNWLPSVERVIKIPPSMMMQSWMGSDFTNDDLVRESSTVDDYAHEIVGDTVIDGRECYRIESIPKPDAPVVWGKVVMCITKEDYLQLRGEFYDEDGRLINILEMSEIKEMGGRVIPTLLRMIPVDKEGHATAIKYNSIQFDVAISESFFSEQNMKRIR
ncbi:MAG: outer membrane lipoprotein-sorting protein [Thermoplasmata archaeon]